MKDDLKDYYNPELSRDFIKIEKDDRKVDKVDLLVVIQERDKEHLLRNYEKNRINIKDSIRVHKNIKMELVDIENNIGQNRWYIVYNF